MPEVQVDRGAIRFVLGGAHIMCPGLTSPGGRMEEDLPAETAVVRLCVWTVERMISQETRQGMWRLGVSLRVPTHYHRPSARRGRRWSWPWA